MVLKNLVNVVGMEKFMQMKNYSKWIGFYYAMNQKKMNGPLLIWVRINLKKYNILKNKV